MNLLSVPEFIYRKKRDGIAIMGSGYSINRITPEQWVDIESNYDTLGFNFYCKSRRPTTWYMVREQCVSPSRIMKGFELEDFFELMKSYSTSCKIIKDLSSNVNNFQHARHLENFDGDGFIFQEPDTGCSAKSFRDDIFLTGIHHGKFTLYDALHFSVAMGYIRILFCGVDLYDNRYFYLPENETLEYTLKGGGTIDSPHPTAAKAIKLVGGVRDFYPNIKLEVQNEYSLLREVIPKHVEDSLTGKTADCGSAVTGSTPVPQPNTKESL